MRRTAGVHQRIGRELSIPRQGRVLALAVLVIVLSSCTLGRSWTTADAMFVLRSGESMQILEDYVIDISRADPWSVEPRLYARMARDAAAQHLDVLRRFETSPFLTEYRTAILRCIEQVQRVTADIDEGLPLLPELRESFGAARALYDGLLSSAPKSALDEMKKLRQELQDEKFKQVLNRDEGSASKASTGRGASGSP